MPKRTRNGLYLKEHEVSFVFDNEDHVIEVLQKLGKPTCRNLVMIQNAKGEDVLPDIYTSAFQEI